MAADKGSKSSKKSDKKVDKKSAEKKAVKEAPSKAAPAKKASVPVSSKEILEKAKEQAKVRHHLLTT